MEKSGYPEYEWHVTWHNGYIAQLKSLKEEFLENGVSEEFICILDDFITKWALRHIRNVDVALGNYLIERNILTI